MNIFVCCVTFIKAYTYFLRSLCFVSWYCRLNKCLCVYEVTLYMLVLSTYEVIYVGMVVVQAVENTIARELLLDFLYKFEVFTSVCLVSFLHLSRPLFALVLLLLFIYRLFTNLTISCCRTVLFHTDPEHQHEKTPKRLFSFP